MVTATRARGVCTLFTFYRNSFVFYLDSTFHFSLYAFLRFFSWHGVVSVHCSGLVRSGDRRTNTTKSYSLLDPQAKGTTLFVTLLVPVPYTVYTRCAALLHSMLHSAVCTSHPAGKPRPITRATIRRPHVSDRAYMYTHIASSGYARCRSATISSHAIPPSALLCHRLPPSLFGALPAYRAVVALHRLHQGCLRRLPVPLALRRRQGLPPTCGRMPASSACNRPAAPPCAPSTHLVRSGQRTGASVVRLLRLI